MKQIPPVNVLSVREQIVQALHDIPPGAKRRAILIPLLMRYQREFPDGIVVNCRHCQQIKNDSDLRFMLKKGWARLVRHHSARSGKTYFQLIT